MITFVLGFTLNCPLFITVLKQARRVDALPVCPPQFGNHFPGFGEEGVPQVPWRDKYLLKFWVVANWVWQLGQAAPSHHLQNKSSEENIINYTRSAVNN